VLAFVGFALDDESRKETAGMLIFLAAVAANRYSEY